MGFFLTFWNYLQTNVLNTISTITTNISTSLAPAAVTFATMYVMLWGYLHLRGAIEEPIMDGVKRIIQLGIVLGIALHLWEYNTVLVDFFISTPTALSAAILGGDAALNIIDTVWQQGAGVAESLISQGSLWDGNIGFYFAGFCVYLFVGLICVWMAYLYCLSLVAVGFLLAIGPLFVLGLLFETTKRFFESWMAQLSNYALIIVIASVAAKLLLNMLQAYAAAASAKGAGVQIAEGVQLCIASSLIMLIMRQVPTMAASLASGVALGTFNALSRLLNSTSSGTGRTLYQFGRGVTDGRAGEKPSRYMPVTRNLGNRLGQQLRGGSTTQLPGGKIARSNVF